MEVLKNVHHKCLANTAGQLTETKYFENSYKVKATPKPVTHQTTRWIERQFKFNNSNTKCWNSCFIHLTRYACAQNMQILWIKTVRNYRNLNKRQTATAD